MNAQEPIPPPDQQVYLGIGSNIDPRANIPRAVALLKASMRVAAVSQVWKTPAVGPAGPDFLNAALCVWSPFPPEVLKTEILRPIETRLGRRRTANKYAPRPIDLDILMVDGQVYEMQVWEQAFLAVPLADLLPDYANPRTGETLAQAAARLSRGLAVETCPEPDLNCYMD